ncbi:MAG: GTP cyclohydrolase I [Microbacteriaceae bacterium]|nr:GTP cyclohydrolase I [Microbacteriaceae bacterium]
MTAPVDMQRASGAVRELLVALGLDPAEAQYARTPELVAQAYAEWCAGVGKDPLPGLRESLLPVGTATGEMVALRDIEFTALCVHHLLPFHGRAHLAYLPGQHIAGLGALARTVALLAARPQTQEQLGEQIAQALQEGLAARGALVVLEARQGCVSDRGVKQQAARSVTVAARGAFCESSRQNAAITLLCGLGGAVVVSGADLAEEIEIAGGSAIFGAKLAEAGGGAA